MFITLKEFLLLEEYNESYSGIEWIRRYSIAKKSYEKYGKDGPSIGTKVFMLEGGHGGGEGVERIFLGLYKDDINCNDFAVGRKSKRNPELIRKSLVPKDYWWRSFYIKEEGIEGKCDNCERHSYNLCYNCNCCGKCCNGYECCK